MSTTEILHSINQEDQTVAISVKNKLAEIEALCEAVYQKLSSNGRLFYIGAGTSGRLGIVDASECPPTFGVPAGVVVGLIAGGDAAIRKSVEYAEDDENQSWFDLKEHGVNDKDFVVGIAASGTTPYVVGGLRHCQNNGIATGCITCNPGSAITEFSDYPIEVKVGPEFLTGSSRMKAGTAQKLVLNMITTSCMIKLGFVIDNKMVDMQLSNNKLVDRGTKMVQQFTGLDYETAKTILIENGSVRKAVEKFKNQNPE